MALKHGPDFFILNRILGEFLGDVSGNLPTGLLSLLTGADFGFLCLGLRLERLVSGCKNDQQDCED